MTVHEVSNLVIFLQTHKISNIPIADKEEQPDDSDACVVITDAEEKLESKGNVQNGVCAIDNRNDSAQVFEYNIASGPPEVKQKIP